ncbi:SPOR domain-containing protein [Thiorhodococcus fuscus]|uniref:SPOR domain-containing protein n=1 Tax=Thiorhodococcus fuscus TaxID=527200 RepID=A0ABW4Y3T0_9GAMM
MANQQDQEMDSNDRPEISGTSDEIALLREELEQQRSEFQSIEVALISRIADVDDDRRHAATRLQRTLQNHREEMDGRLRHQNVIVTITFILFVVIVSVLLVFAYAKFDQARQTFASEVQELRQTLEEVKSSIAVPQSQEQTPATREKLSQLSTAVKAITESLERLANEQESMATSAAQPAPSDLAIDSNVEPQQVTTPTPPAPEPAKVLKEAPEPVVDAEQATEPLDQASTQSAETSPEADTPTVVEDASTQDSPAKEIAETPSDATEEPQAEETRPKPETEPEMALEPAPAPEVAYERESAPASAAVSTQEPDPESDADIQTSTQETQTTSPATTEAAEPTTSPPERISVGGRPYTVQLMGFYSLDSLLSFARRHGLTDRPVYDEESYQGRPWFVLIHSLHATKEEAEASVAALPPDLAKLDIWIRKLEPDATIYRPAPRTE